MFLKRVVLHGFKSFADRTEFDFGRGLTGVVGPNGCGKSNILDATRWVLGEQSAKSLRGDRMLDVLFNGSRSRKAANFAEVQLTFDNSGRRLALDEDEVTISRLLYRSGDSEYRVNGKSCRLKDVRDLFLDTGVGVSAYSIIEQGRVDAILRANPQQRRELFEEAAGISRYRARRVEAQRRLERTEANLLRLNDVLEELERRVRSLKLAAGKARNYRELDQRLRELRGGHALAEYHELQLRGERQRRDLHRFEQLMGAQRSRIERLDGVSEDIESAARNLEERLSVAEQELSRLDREHAATQERVRGDELRLQELSAGRERDTRQADEFARRLTELQDRLAEARRDLENLAAGEEEQRRTAKQLAEQRTTLRRDFEQRSASIEAMHREIQQAERQESDAAATHARLSERAGERRQQADALVERAAGLEQSEAEARGEAEACERESATISAEEQVNRSGVAAVDERLARLEADLAHNAQESLAARERRGAAQSRIELIEELERSLDGVGRGVRDLVAWRDAGVGGVLGLVADLLAIDDPRIESLGGLLARFEHHLVVRSDDEFLSALAEHGRPSDAVDVIALDRLPAEPVSDATSVQDAVRILDWVRCAPGYRDLARHLLGNAWYVTDAAAALRLAAADREAIFVTQEGEVIGPGPRLQVGMATSSPGLISRKMELRQARDLLEQLDADLARLERGRLALAQSRDDAGLERRELVERADRLRARRQELTLESQRARRDLDRLSQERAGLTTSIEDVRRELNEISQRQADLESRRNELQACRAALVEASQRDALTLAEARSALADLEQRLTDAQVEAGRCHERRQAREAIVRELSEQLARVESQRAMATREALEAGGRIEAMTQELARSREWAERLTALAAAQRTTATELRSRRDRLRTRVDAAHRVLKQSRRELEQCEQVVNELHVARREAEVRLEALTVRTSDELSIDLASLYAEYTPEERDWDAVRDEIEEIRAKIARLGNVNLDAIDELEQVQPRFDELTAQRGDLVTSIEQLRALIVELDEESQTRFWACFNEVREHFQELFRKLFGGGKADVMLEDPERPLECGIEIIARPPGKEPQSISLLSGGEKTMAAVGLLFAIFKRKPSPFAILDEVDAALDDSNIDRFNTMLVEFLSESQFIVITHSKRTMQRADVLYGITMEEPGVSKRVSVRFDNREDRSHVA